MKTEKAAARAAQTGNMKIEHLAIWVNDIEAMRRFYTTYFDAESNEKYHNPNKNYTSYFLSFGEDKTRIELMHRSDIAETVGKRGFTKGLAHLAISVGNKTAVNELTERLRADGYTIACEQELPATDITKAWS
jgi:lactoylglutathione lyase